MTKSRGIVARIGRHWRTRGNRARDVQDWRRAAEAYRFYLRFAPSDAAIWIQLGHMLSEARTYRDADLAYARANALEPGDADLLLCWGHSRKEAGDLGRAYDLYAQSAAVDGNADALRQIAWLQPRHDQDIADTQLFLSARTHARPHHRPLSARGATADHMPTPPAQGRYAWNARVETVKRFEWQQGSEVAILVTHSASGVIKPHLYAYMAGLNAQAIACLLVVVADRQVDLDPCVVEAADGIYVRENAGFDFAAWAHALYLHPELYGASILFLLNDSVLPATDRLGALFGRVRASEADLVGLTQSQEHGWHVQSYFLALRQNLLASERLQDFWADVGILDDKDAVIRAYEVRFARAVEEAGLAVTTLYPTAGARNPTLYSWRQLLRKGFPFVKLSLLSGAFGETDTSGLHDALEAASFDMDLVDAFLAADSKASPGALGGSLYARRLPPTRKKLPGARIAFYGPWNFDCREGAAARDTIDLLARLPILLNRHAVGAPFKGYRSVSPAIDIVDFQGIADIAIVQLDPVDWTSLSDRQRAEISLAGRVVGRWEHCLAGQAMPEIDAVLSASGAIASPTEHEATLHLVPRPIEPMLPATVDRAAVLEQLGAPPGTRIVLTSADEPGDVDRMDAAAIVRAFRVSDLVSRGWILLVEAPAATEQSAVREALLGGSTHALGVRILERRLTGEERRNAWSVVDVYASADTSGGGDAILLEAMAAGRLVVAPQRSGLPGLLDQTTAALVPLTSTCNEGNVRHVDEIALAAVLQSAAAAVEHDTTDRGVAAQERVRALLSVDAAALRLETALTAILATQRAPAHQPPLDIAPERVGIPIERASLPDHIVPLLLRRDGTPKTRNGAAQPYVGGDTKRWCLIAPGGTLLAPDFVRLFDQYRAARPDIAIFHADDVAADATEPNDRLRLKPQFDPILLAAQYYAGWPLLVREDVFLGLNGLDSAMRTAASANLLFRGDAAGHAIGRIPHVLLAYPAERVMPDMRHYALMVARQPRFAGMMVESKGGGLRLARRWQAGAMPAVTILIATCRAKADARHTHIERLLDAIATADWPMDRLNVIVGDDRGDDAPWAARSWPFNLRYIATPRASEQPFNYAAKMNALTAFADTEQLVFLNDDVRPIHDGWLKALQDFAVDPDVGGVGARLLFPDGSLQHAGIIPHRSSTAHAWIRRRRALGTYQDWACVHRQWSMVTGAVFATRRSIMDQVGGFDETFALEFNDTDLCLRLRAHGYRIVYTPYSEFEHSEKASRGEMPPLGSDRARFRNRWRDWLENDPCWHPLLRRDVTDLTPLPEAGAWYLADNK
ncbi:rhamnan synthesis F family protein [Sphingomonas nostoxanthinifaciens]|uniref:rhamnan synthesis F family protein n=1 Tax=Sphingomonas nostoxanthinifaciens TaxID=2872652 RepID=UPI001CC1EA36|nr:rhamnan synthesis F family protein [Sphingomonas nostoxanthinifaciens]UAK24996.1 glycosyltransferase [Sphingomonas nostoxanthinifaciens]